MLTQNPLPRHDPKRMVRLQATRALFANGKRMEIDEIFEVQAQQAGEILAAGRVKFASDDDRSLVYKTVVL